VAVRTSALLKRAAHAARDSKRVALRVGFDPRSEADWIELVKDIAALANSGGGVLVLGPAGTAGRDEIDAHVTRFTSPAFHDLDVFPVERDGGTVEALVVRDVAGGPLAFTRQGAYVDPAGQEHVAFLRGGVYFRHGRKSEPATGADVHEFITRQLDATRRRWLGNIREVMHAPDTAELALVETTERDEQGRPTLIRLTTDRNAPLYGQLDPDRSHPYRQTEVIHELNGRLGEGAVNQFDVLSVRRVHEISEETSPEFVHVPKFGSPQYSDAFVDWLVERAEHDPAFFSDAKARYIAARRRRGKR
jgi:hypothetical protein